MNIYRDFLERLIWTFFAASGGALAGAALFGWPAYEAAASAGLAAVVNAVTIFARWRLTVLPDPGAGLPKLPTGN